MRQWIRRLLWIVAVITVVLPFWLAASSPLQAGRELAYVSGALAGVLALSLLFVQPLLAAGLLAGFGLLQERRWHRWTGIALLTAVSVHVIGLYLTSPDDMTDALLLVAPTPFSLYGVIALWALVLTAVSALVRFRRGLRLSAWNKVHSALTVIVVLSSCIHAWMIDGTMNSLSKIVTCLLVVLATAGGLIYLRRSRP